MTLDEVRKIWVRRLDAQKLAHRSDAILALARPAVLFRAAPHHEAAATGCSRVGGDPDLPPDFLWPTDMAMLRAGSRQFFWQKSRAPEFANLPLRFVAQISLRDVQASGACDLSLPGNGLLSLFFDARSLEQRERKGWQVFWFPNDSDLRPRTGAEPHSRFSLLPEPTLTFPDELDAAGLTAKEEDSFRALVGGLEEGCIQVGGWASIIQGAMEIECAMLEGGIVPDREGYAAAERLNLKEAAREWKLVLQVGSFAARDLNWGDFGSLYVWMRDVDILAQAFDRSRLFVQFY